MKSNRIILVLGSIAAAVTVAAIVLPALARSSNCGGNSAALYLVREYASVAKFSALESSNGVFQVTKVSEDDRAGLRRCARNHWIPRARFLVSTNLLTTNDLKARRILIVCDQSFRNVPQRWTGTAPATHAVGYSDGSAALISPVEFNALDRSSFAYLDELHPAP